MPAGMPPAHAEPKPDEVRLYLRDPRPALDQLPGLRPLSHRVTCKRYTEDALQPRARFAVHSSDISDKSPAPAEE
jgi:hypothetical protein